MMHTIRPLAACLAIATAVAACDAHPERPAASPDPAAHAMVRSLMPQPELEPAAREFCHASVRRAHRGASVTILDSLEVTRRGADTVLVAGAAERTGEDGVRYRHGWTCDAIREADGRWRSWHFGLEPMERVALRD